MCSKTKGFEVEERLVYQIIEDAGNKGIVLLYGGINPHAGRETLGLFISIVSTL